MLHTFLLEIDPYVLPAYTFAMWVFIVVDILLLIGFVYSLMRAAHYHPNYTKAGHHGEGAHGGAHGHVPSLRDIALRERWRAIEKKVAVGTPESARLAIIEADALVDTALRGMQIQGEHLADRLTALDDGTIKSMSRIWRAHRLRNDLVHTPGFAVSPADAQRTMDDYEAFLKEIEVID